MFSGAFKLISAYACEEEGWKGDLCHAICANSWNDAKAILDQNPTALTARINDKGRTALHVASIFGHVTIVEELLKLLPPEFLTTLDSEGDTALELASLYSESTQVAKCLVNKNRDILGGIPNENNNLPVIHAFLNGRIEMGRFLYSVTPLEFLTGDNHGSNLLHYCLKAKCLDIALDLLQRCGELLLVPKDKDGWTPIHDIASLNTAILSPSELVFWKRWIYNCENPLFFPFFSIITVDFVYVIFLLFFRL
ncbi:hypothetical protein K1719_036534 [Acacia pycnantha]|nr:hypothetical protein K1719_036534 [Acacia pycnantha]